MISFCICVFLSAIDTSLPLRNHSRFPVLHFSRLTLVSYRFPRKYPQIERCYRKVRAEMSRTKDVSMISLLALHWDQHYFIPCCSQMCTSRCRIPTALHTRSLIPDFQVAVVFSPLSYHSKGRHLFCKICTLGFLPQFFLFVIISFYKKKLVLFLHQFSQSHLYNALSH